MLENPENAHIREQYRVLARHFRSDGSFPSSDIANANAGFTGSAVAISLTSISLKRFRIGLESSFGGFPAYLKNGLFRTPSFVPETTARDLARNKPQL